MLSFHKNGQQLDYTQMDFNTDFNMKLHRDRVMDEIVLYLEAFLEEHFGREHFNEDETRYIAEQTNKVVAVIYNDNDLRNEDPLTIEGDFYRELISETTDLYTRYETI